MPVLPQPRRKLIVHVLDHGPQSPYLELLPGFFEVLFIRKTFRIKPKVV
jgi:hypothetical protein